MPTYPVDLEAWLAPFRVVSQVFELGEGLQVQHQTAGGEILRSGGAARLWRGSLVLAPIDNRDAAGLEARAHVLRGAGASILVRDYRRNGTAAGQIKAVNAGSGSTMIALQQAPVGRVIAAGDYLAWDYAGRRALHQVVTGATVNGSGETTVEVVPPIRSGFAAGAAVTIGAAKCRAVIIPGSLRIGVASAAITDGISFDWIQTLRENP